MNYIQHGSIVSDACHKFGFMPRVSMADENAFVEQWVAEAHERARQIVQEVSVDRSGKGKSKFDRSGKGKGSGKGKLVTAAERAATMANEVLTWQMKLQRRMPQ